MINTAVHDRLDRLRTRFPGCRAVAFADLSTSTVLAASTREKMAQERLDALCDTARTSLCGALAQSVAQTAFQSSDEPMHAVSFDVGSLTCVIRSPVSPVEALCCVCDPGTAVAEMIAQGAVVLADLCEEA
ncbi:hypothetical protein [Roseobacter sp.]|uniref:hypothetical protein n=1 Tax=Roseobacter sp. TaxID=1907202 RepID=UPI00296750FD|nr:hypothetical protein [Roseobacter sp.]MDW3181957.1 hypothetical protein [Roseobacter sp.]